VIADKNKVHSQFPIPLISRLEKHYLSATSLLTDEQKRVKKDLENWAKEFVTPQIFYKLAIYLFSAIEFPKTFCKYLNCVVIGKYFLHWL